MEFSCKIVKFLSCMRTYPAWSDLLGQSENHLTITLKTISVSYLNLVKLFWLANNTPHTAKTSDSSPSSSPSKIGTSGEYVPYKAPWYSMPSYDTIMRNIKDTEIKQQVLNSTHASCSLHPHNFSTF
jgi:hypothetical protein